MVIGMEIGLSPGDFVLDGDPARPLNFRPMFIIVIVISLQHCTGIIGLFKLKLKLQYSMHSIFRKFDRTQSVRCAQLHHIATIAEVGVAN